MSVVRGESETEITARTGGAKRVQIEEDVDQDHQRQNDWQ